MVVILRLACLPPRIAVAAVVVTCALTLGATLSAAEAARSAAACLARRGRPTGRAW